VIVVMQSMFGASTPPVLTDTSLSSAFSERIILFDRKACKKIRIKVPKKLIMFALKVGDAFQSKISALQTSDGISLPPTPSI
jgi:hypothetical protein